MRSITAGVVALVMVALANSSATAGGQCPDGTSPSPVVGGICIPAAEPGNPGNGGSSGGGPGGGSGGGGTGSGGAGDDPCEWSLASPQPPAAAPEWQGHSPDDGDLWMCVLPVRGNPVFQFRPNGEEAPPPDPAELARRALDELRLTVPDIHLAPAPPRQTYVGLETWLWMPAGQWSTLTKSVKAGDTTVTVSAVPARATWNMGAGVTTCFGAGTPWKAGLMPEGASTTCKYVYDRVSDFQPDRKFRVASTITFDVRWRCSGTCLATEGVLGEVDGLSGVAAISVGERQSVNTNGQPNSETGVR